MNNNQITIQFGVPRSGSTLIYQIMKKALSNPVRKIHSFNRADKIVCTYRDFRDSAISNWRISTNPIPRQKITLPELKNNCKYIKTVINSLNQYKKSCPKKCLFLKYEDFLNNYAYIFDSLEKFYKIKINPEKRKEIEKYTSIEENRKRSLKFKNFSQWDPDTQIHGLHIYKGNIGVWKEFIMEENINYINNFFKTELLIWGYKI